MEYGLKALKLSEEEMSNRIHEVAKLLDIEKVLDEHPFSLGKGERQRVAVASILVLKPRILVVDEPTTGQDWDGIQNMMKLIDELHANGTTIIMITHDMDVVATHANRVIVMAKGSMVADGSVRDVFKQEKALKDAYVARPQIPELSERLGLESMALTAQELGNALISTLEASR